MTEAQDAYVVTAPLISVKVAGEPRNLYKGSHFLADDSNREHIESLLDLKFVEEAPEPELTNDEIESLRAEEEAEARLLEEKQLADEAEFRKNFDEAAKVAADKAEADRLAAVKAEEEEARKAAPTPKNTTKTAGTPAGK